MTNPLQPGRLVDQPAGAKPDGGLRTPTRRSVLSYLAFAVLPALACLALLALSHGPAPTATRSPHAAAAAAAPVPGGTLYRLLAAIVVVLVAAHLLGALAHRLGQPRVVGEMVAGFLIGPSLLGAVLPMGKLISPATTGTLNALAQLGVVLFMFLVGAELPQPGRTAPTALVLGHSAIAVPFLAGLTTALLLPGELRPAATAPHAYLLFMGLLLSITAFPVLARILTERGLTVTPVGSLAIGSAAVLDVTGWGVLAFVLASGQRGRLAVALSALGVIVLLMWFGLRPLLARLVARAERGDREQGPVMVTILVVALLAALGTDAIGVHAIFGAFLAGVIMPRGSRLVARFTQQVEGLTLWLLVPLFFATVGLRTDLTRSGLNWWWLVVLLAVAVAGKTLGVVPVGLSLGVAPRPAAGLAVMMNCRGLTELIVLSVGYDAGLVSPALYSAFIIITLVTTVATNPLLSLLRLDGTLRRPGGGPVATARVAPAR